MLLEFLGLAKRRIPAPTFPTPITGKMIFSYLQKLDSKNRKRLRDEIYDRGLSFGDLRVKKFFVGPKFEIANQQTKNVSLVDLKRMLDEIISLRGIKSIVLNSYDEEWNSFSLLREDGDKNYCFLNVSMFGGGLRIEAYNIEATNVVLILAKNLGLKTEPAHFANESDIPISKIVERAYKWHDTERDLYFLDVRFDESLVKSLVYLSGGSLSKYKEGEKMVEVYCLSGYEPLVKINNVFIKAKAIKYPTPYMTQARIPTN